MIGAMIAKKKVTRAFESLNNRDLKSFIADWADDCTFTYPGNIHVSGTVQGKRFIEDWFDKYMEQFPKIKFTLKRICVERLLDFTGTNVLIAHWDVEFINVNGFEIHNNGVTIIHIKMGKATKVIDYIFDTGEKFRTAWGAA